MSWLPAATPFQGWPEHKSWSATWSRLSPMSVLYPACCWLEQLACKQLPPLHALLVCLARTPCRLAYGQSLNDYCSLNRSMILCRLATGESLIGYCSLDSSERIQPCSWKVDSTATPDIKREKYHIEFWAPITSDQSQIESYGQVTVTACLVALCLDLRYHQRVCNTDHPAAASWDGS